MAKSPNFRPAVLEVRQHLADTREQLRAQHEARASGVQISARLTEMLDRAVRILFDAAVDDLGEPLRQHVALVPHGGTGRRDVAPYSDLDLMILHDLPGDARIADLAQRLMQDLYDAGIDPGHSVRTAEEAIALARDDAKICTSLIESRFLVGNELLHQAFRGHFAAMTQRRFRALHEAIVLARREERVQYGETMYLLAPNVKRSRGALREMQLLRWIAFCKFGTGDTDVLHRKGALSGHDVRRLNQAHEFLLRLRNDLHFHAGSAADVLTRPEQVRVAEKWAYRGTQGMLPVEQFMREYFQHTAQVRSLVSRFVKSVAPEPTVAWALTPMFSHSVEGNFRVGRTTISATSSGQQKLRTDLDEVLRLADLANLYDRRIDHKTWDAVYRAAPSYSSEISPEVAQRFLSLMARPARLAELLRRLHELRVLEKILPPFEHARCLLQFNEYHKYTVDEHSFRAVRAATELLDQPGPLGDAYRAVRHRRVLHLALLLHDVGKGFPEDHSEVGRRLAGEMCARLNLPADEAEQVQFLVHKHLLMSHLAFRRDTSDPQVVVRFAVEVGSPELLQMLYVHTCADLAAVGPGVLNDWKVDVLTDLYFRTRAHLGGNLDESGERTQRLRQQIIAQFPSELDDSWARRQLDSLPGSILRGQSPTETIELLQRLKKLPARQASAWAEYHADSQTIDYSVIVNSGHGRGIFSKLTGALTSRQSEILSAEIYSLADDYILDRFTVHDIDSEGPPSAERLEEICSRLTAAVNSDKPPVFRRVWGQSRESLRSELSPLPTQIKFDNSSSEQHTIIEVFTFDRAGLLYAIARELYELQLSIGAARIATYLDQVVDVFYVTRQFDGGKIDDPDQREHIRVRLLAAIAQDSDDEEE